VTATILLIPFAIPLSSTTTNLLISPVRLTCVPPQNSIEEEAHLLLDGSDNNSLMGNPIETIRTGSGYV